RYLERLTESPGEIQCSKIPSPMRLQRARRLAKELGVLRRDFVAAVLARAQQPNGSSHRFAFRGHCGARCQFFGRITRQFASSDAAPRKIEPIKRWMLAR